MYDAFGTSGHLREVKNKRNYKLSSLKVVAVTYKRWSLTRGSNYSDLTWEISVFWKKWLLKRGGRRGRFDCIPVFQFYIHFV